MRACVPILVPMLVVALALPVRAEERSSPAKPAEAGPLAPPDTKLSIADQGALSRADQNGLRSCLYGGCLCGGGQCANGEPLKGALFTVATGTLALFGAGLTIGLLNPPESREPRAGQLAMLTVVNVSLLAVWAWSLADAYGKGRENALDPGPTVPVVKAGTNR